MKRAFVLKKIRNSFERFRKRFYDEYSICDYWRKRGVRIGKDCRILGEPFLTEPYLVRIGNHVTIAGGAILVTHDGGVWVLRRERPDLNIQKFGSINIFDNCFIGQNAIILPNVAIGPNSIVAAGSVVTEDVPPETIVGGVPARPINTIEKYREEIFKDPMNLSWPRDRKELKRQLIKYFWDKERRL